MKVSGYDMITWRVCIGDMQLIYGNTVVPASSTLLISNLPATSNLVPLLQVKSYHVILPDDHPHPTSNLCECAEWGLLIAGTTVLLYQRKTMLPLHCCCPRAVVSPLACYRTKQHVYNLLHLYLNTINISIICWTMSRFLWYESLIKHPR